MTTLITITELLDINAALAADLAYQYSLDNKDATNMRMVLRAYGYDHSILTAQSLININL